MKKVLYSVCLSLCMIVYAQAQGQSSVNFRSNYVGLNPSATYAIEIDENQFAQRIYNPNTSPTEWKYIGDRPCIVDFYTTWCGPCKRLTPVLESLAEEYDGKIYIYRIDAEKNANLSRAFGIRSYPSLLFIPMQGKPNMAVGALPRGDLDRLIHEILLTDTTTGEQEKR